MNDAVAAMPTIADVVRHHAKTHRRELLRPRRQACLLDEDAAAALELLAVAVRNDIRKIDTE